MARVGQGGLVVDYPNSTKVLPCPSSRGPLPQLLKCQPDQDNEALLSSSVVVKITGGTSAIASQAIARYTPLLRAAGSAKPPRDAGAFARETLVDVVVV